MACVEGGDDDEVVLDLPAAEQRDLAASVDGPSAHATLHSGSRAHNIGSSVAAAPPQQEPSYDRGEAGEDHNNNSGQGEKGIEPETLQRLRDHLLIVIGSDGAAERLGERRLQAGGRLCVVEVTDHSRIVETELLPDQAPEYWSPPSRALQSSSSLAGRLLKGMRDKVGRDDWMKKGPDVFALAARQTLQILTMRGCQVGVRVVAEDSQSTIWEVSGAVALRPSSAEAEAVDVVVQDWDAMPLYHTSQSSVLISMVVAFVVFSFGRLLGFIMEEGLVPGQFPWWRCIMWAPFVFADISAQTSRGFADVFTGFPPPTSYCLIVGGAGAVIFALCSATGGSGYSAVGNAHGAGVGLVYLMYARTRSQAPARSLKRHLKLLAWTFCLTVGVGYSFFVVALLYLAMLGAGHTFLAAAGLPLMTSVVEIGAISASAKMYEVCVQGPRTKALGSVHGDQRKHLTVNVAYAHGWAEAARLASLLAGTISQPDNLSWIGTLVQCLIGNVFIRLGWFEWLFSYWSEKIQRGPSSVSMTSSVTVLHNHVKYCFGYPRFVTPLAIAACQLVRFRNFDPSLPNFPLFNLTTVAALAGTLAIEIIEDIIVAVNPFLQPPFKPWHAKAYTCQHPYALYQGVALTRTGSGGSGCAVAYRGDGDGGRPHCSYNLHGTRPLYFDYTLGMVMMIAILCYGMLELLLGPGFLAGTCPRPLSDMRVAIFQAFFVEAPFACE